MWRSHGRAAELQMSAWWRAFDASNPTRWLLDGARHDPRPRFGARECLSLACGWIAFMSGDGAQQKSGRAPATRKPKPFSRQTHAVQVWHLVCVPLMTSALTCSIPHCGCQTPFGCFGIPQRAIIIVPHAICCYPSVKSTGKLISTFWFSNSVTGTLNSFLSRFAVFSRFYFCGEKKKRTDSCIHSI